MMISSYVIAALTTLHGYAYPLSLSERRYRDDTRGLHDGEWFIEQGRSQAAAATRRAGLLLLLVTAGIVGAFT